MRVISIILLVACVAACSHPLEIVGEGDILSASGDRDCLLEDSLSAAPNCTENFVAGDYEETYFAVPRSGWAFDGWVNYCADTETNECSFSVVAAQVLPFWGEAMPPLGAVFVREDCATEGDVEFLPPINWASQGSQTRISLASEIKTVEFTTTSNPGYLGQISIASTTGNSGVQRRVWFSACAGGEPLDDAACDKTGTSSTVVRWSQLSPGSISRCTLETDTRYYLNVQNLNCMASSCDVYRNRYTNNNP